jgi:hypothetical protein
MIMNGKDIRTSKEAVVNCLKGGHLFWYLPRDTVKNHEN